MAQRDVPHAARRAAANPLHVVVDLNRCQAYAQCCFLAPTVFQLHGEEALWYDPAPDAAEREQVLRAVAARSTCSRSAASGAGSYQSASSPCN